MEENVSECDDSQNSSNPVSQTTSKNSSVGKVSSTERDVIVQCICYSYILECINYYTRRREQN